jgi:hypothetical protein
MTTHWRCTAEPEKHGVYEREKCAIVRVGDIPGQPDRYLARLACPLCRCEHKEGWVKPAVKP